MQALQQIAQKHRLKLIEDASQAHGARYHGKLIGSLSDAAGFSCMNTKLLAATELGVMVTDDRDTFDRAVLLSQHTGRMTRPVMDHGGGLRDEYYPYIDSLIYNYQPTGIVCVLLMDQLPRLAGWNRIRTANRNRLVERISDLDFLRFPVSPENVEPAFLMTNFNYDEERAGGVTRETFVKALNEEGVHAVIYIKQAIPLWFACRRVPAMCPRRPGCRICARRK
jgi:dTDP-4-amino-4,6-dideoxygalactose transaminase